jgi:LmbE family N-acetylglucosaminyl deacetylase
MWSESEVKLFQPETKILLVTAHPDDSEFYVGGTLTRLKKAGATIDQIICTYGDKGYYPFSKPEAMATVRRQEAQSAADAWGARSLSFLGKPDGRLEYHREIIEELKERIDALKPDLVLCFDDEYPPRASHSDHRFSGEATRIAARESKTQPLVLAFSTRGPTYFVDISKEWDAKVKLLQLHKSQFAGQKLNQITGFVMEMAQSDGLQANTELAEGFRVIAPPKPQTLKR